jgi:hypothetical protein
MGGTGKVTCTAGSKYIGVKFKDFNGLIKAAAP